MAKPVVLRDQECARRAYEFVDKVQKDDQKDYKIAVNDLGAAILRSGLAAAMASLERLKKRGELIRGHLATLLGAARLPGLEGATGATLPSMVRKLPVDGYMLATREALQIATWLKRAAQATFEDS